MSGWAKLISWKNGDAKNSSIAALRFPKLGLFQHPAKVSISSQFRIVIAQNSFDDLSLLISTPAVKSRKILVEYDYVCLAPGFTKEALEAYEAWEGKEKVPRRVQELMMVLKIEVSRRYGPPCEPEKTKIPTYKDVRLA